MYPRWWHQPKTVSPRPYCRSRRGRNGLGSETTAIRTQCHHLICGGYKYKESHNGYMKRLNGYTKSTGPINLRFGFNVGIEGMHFCKKFGFQVRLASHNTMPNTIFCVFRVSTNLPMRFD